MNVLFVTIRRKRSDKKLLICGEKVICTTEPTGVSQVNASKKNSMDIHLLWLHCSSGRMNVTWRRQCLLPSRHFASLYFVRWMKISIRRICESSSSIALPTSQLSIRMLVADAAIATLATTTEHSPGSHSLSSSFPFRCSLSSFVCIYFPQ